MMGSTLLGSNSQSARAALGALPAAGETEGAIVELSVDGMRCFVAFVLDSEEHQRRRSLGLGPITDRRLLHALWTLPEDVGVPWGEMDPVDAETLRSQGHGVVEDRDDGVTRCYRSIGRVTAAAAVAGRLGDAVQRIGEFPPIFRRLAVAVGPGTVRLDEVDLARCYGIGGVVLTESDVTVVADAAPPQLGVPAVYRWWVTELAYRNAAYTV